MSRAIAAHHGLFGRACLYEMDRPMAMHAHREGHLLFHIDGSVSTLTVSGTQYHADANNAVAVSPLQPHDFRLGKSGSVRLLVLYINHSWFGEYCQNPHSSLTFGRTRIRLTEELQDRVATIVNMLASMGAAPSIDAQLRELTQSCYAQSWHHDRIDGREAKRFSVARDHRIRKSMLHLKQSIEEGDVNVDKVAAKVGLSRPHFYRLFRENLGITPNVYLNILRMEVAIDRLVKTDQAVTSIGLDLGFASQASFTRFFGANVGIPPTNYRRVAQLA